MVVVPLHHNGGAVGVLKVLATKPNAFSEREARALQLMAGLIGAAMSNAAESEYKQEPLKRVDYLSFDDLDRWCFGASSSAIEFSYKKSLARIWQSSF